MPTTTRSTFWPAYRSGSERALERIEKTRAVGFRESPAAALPERIGGAEIGGKIAHRQHVADIRRRQRLSVGLQDFRARLDAFRGKWDVVRDDDIAGARVRRDPFVGLVRAFGNESAASPSNCSATGGSRRPTTTASPNSTSATRGFSGCGRTPAIGLRCCPPTGGRVGVPESRATTRLAGTSSTTAASIVPATRCS